MKADYDTTLARIAGNIAAGFVSKVDRVHLDDLPRWSDTVITMSVQLARGIVAEIKRTEPGQTGHKPPDGRGAF